MALSVEKRMAFARSFLRIDRLTMLRSTSSLNRVSVIPRLTDIDNFRHIRTPEVRASRAEKEEKPRWAAQNFLLYMRMPQ